MKVRTPKLLTVGGTLLALIAAAPASTQPAVQSSPSGLDLGARDLSVRPGDDFFRYALGTWVARAVIRDDQAEAGVDVEVAERVQRELHELIERCASTPGNPTEARISALYRSFMDEARLETLDDRPLRHDLELIKAAATHAQFARLMGASYSGFGASFFFCASRRMRVTPSTR